MFLFGWVAFTFIVDLCYWLPDSFHCCSITFVRCSVRCSALDPVVVRCSLLFWVPCTDCYFVLRFVTPLELFHFVTSLLRWCWFTHVWFCSLFSRSCFVVALRWFWTHTTHVVVTFIRYRTLDCVRRWLFWLQLLFYVYVRSGLFRLVHSGWMPLFAVTLLLLLLPRLCSFVPVVTRGCCSLRCSTLFCCHAHRSFRFAIVDRCCLLICYVFVTLHCYLCWLLTCVGCSLFVVDAFVVFFVAVFLLLLRSTFLPFGSVCYGFLLVVVPLITLDVSCYCWFAPLLLPRCSHLFVLHSLWPCCVHLPFTPLHLRCCSTLFDLITVPCCCSVVAVVRWFPVWLPFVEFVRLLFIVVRCCYRFPYVVTFSRSVLGCRCCYAVVVVLRSVVRCCCSLFVVTVLLHVTLLFPRWFDCLFRYVGLVTPFVPSFVLRSLRLPTLRYVGRMDTLGVYRCSVTFVHRLMRSALRSCYVRCWFGTGCCYGCCCHIYPDVTPHCYGYVALPLPVVTHTPLRSRYPHGIAVVLVGSFAAFTFPTPLPFTLDFRWVGPTGFSFWLFVDSSFCWFVLRSTVPVR